MAWASDIRRNVDPRRSTQCALASLDIHSGVKIADEGSHGPCDPRNQHCRSDSDRGDRVFYSTDSVGLVLAWFPEIV